MGDGILIKIFLFILSLMTFLFAYSENLIKEYKEMFEKISQKRVGLDEKEIEKVKSPFVITTLKGQKNKLKIIQKVNYTLEAIVNDKVLINGKWYQLYSKIGDGRIISINNGIVLIKGNNYLKRLTIRKKNDYIFIK